MIGLHDNVCIVTSKHRLVAFRAIFKRGFMGSTPEMLEFFFALYKNYEMRRANVYALCEVTYSFCHCFLKLLKHQEKPLGVYKMQ